MPEMRVDLVLPVYNEERVLPTVFESLARQVDQQGRPLPRAAFRVIAVNNASTDCSREILAAYASDPLMPETVVLDEPDKGNVQARARGGAFAIQDQERRRYPLIVHADADNTYPPSFVQRIQKAFSAGSLDVLSYLGYESTEFWRRVPRLAKRHFEEVGSINFGPETLAELAFDERCALLTHQVHADFQNVPTHTGLAMHKDIYSSVGGYVREFNQDGTERLGTARNLMFRIDRRGARLSHVLTPCVVVNPRRYLLEAVDYWAGRSYTDGMTDLRAEIGDEHYRQLDRLADRLDYETARRNAVQRYIIDPCLARPERLLTKRDYFGSALPDLCDRIERFYASHDVRLYSEVRPLSDALVDAHCRTILSNIRRLRGLA